MYIPRLALFEQQEDTLTWTWMHIAQLLKLRSDQFTGWRPVPAEETEITMHMRQQHSSNSNILLCLFDAPLTK